MSEIEIKGLDVANRRLEVTSKELTPGLQRTMLRIGEMARGHMQSQFLSGSPLKVRTGKLRSNWQVRGVRRGQEFTVIVGTNTSYARAQNDGVRGVQAVSAHTRRVRASGGGRRARSQQARLRSRSEARASSQHRSRLNAQSQASHGMSKSQLNVLKRGQRKALGIQAGPSGPRGASSGGLVSVRSHSRFMKLRGHHYVERTLRDITPRAIAMLTRFQQSVLDGRSQP